MSSTAKFQKTCKYKHHGRGGNFLKGYVKLRGVSFYNSTQRRVSKNVGHND